VELIEHLDGRMDLEDTTERIKKNTRRLAKSRRTWFKTFTDIHWLDIKPEEPSERIFDRTRALSEHIG
jgi:tRNA dimethylallyltransferase